MRSPLLALVGKETKQNALVYLSPFPFILCLLIVRTANPAILPPWIGQVFGYAFPLTLAVSVGLQAFDVEEDAQTRDFLLVKPLSVRFIIWSKFWLGLTVLVFWSVLSLYAGNPELLAWPRPLPVSTWLGAMVILGAILTYTASYLSGLWVHGPRKLVASSLMAILVMGWAFFSWSNWTTILVHQVWLVERPALQTVLFYAAGLMSALFALHPLLMLSLWILQGKPRLMEQKTLMFNLGLSILIPLLALGFNLKYHPPLRAANFIGLELFGPDAAFWTVEGSWRPNRDELGVAGVGNELALTRLGTKPKPVYRGRFQQGQTLQDLVWAPDGASIAFVEDGEVRVLRIGQKVPLNLGRGSSPCWSHDSRQIMFCQENERSVAIQTQNASRILHQLELYLADLADGSVEPYLRVYSTGTMWTWDSMLGQFYILDASGLIITWRNGSAGSAKLSGLDSGIFWHRLVPIPGRQGVFFLAVLAMTAVDSPYYTVGFYEFDAIEMRVSALRSIPRAKVTDVIIDAKTGNCLLGYSGIYRPIRLYEEKE